MKKVLILVVLFFTSLAVIGLVKRGKKNASLEIAGSTTLLPVTQAASEEYQRQHPTVKVNVQGGGSSAGIEAVANGAVEIGMTSRELKGEEEKLELTKIPVALDAIAIIVNPSNPIDTLTGQQARAIFSGEITNWAELGGEDKKIVVVNRDEASGTREAFSKLLMGDEKFTKVAVVQPGNGQVRAIVSSTKEAIGYLSLGYVNKEVKTVALDGVKPNLDEIKAGRYRLQRTLYYLIKGDVSSLAQDFIDFVLSDETQETIIGSEFIPITEVQ
jgi:phosphate transport system substrate-binding protein